MGVNLKEKGRGGAEGDSIHREGDGKSERGKFGGEFSNVTDSTFLPRGAEWESLRLGVVFPIQSRK